MHRKTISCYQVAEVTLFWAQKRKLDAKYSTIVSQPSKCLKFRAFREGCFVINVEYRYLSETLETFYYHQFYKKRSKIISVNYMIMMRHSVNNNTRMGLVVSLCSNSNHLIGLSPPSCLKF